MAVLKILGKFQEKKSVTAYTIFPLIRGNQQYYLSKRCHFFFQNKNETKIFTINKPNIMEKSKRQQ